MIAGVIKAAVVSASVAAVLYNPAAHISKHFVLSEARYHGLDLVGSGGARVMDAETLFFTEDRFMLPFLNRVEETYSGADHRTAHWIFPFLMGGRDVEEKMVNSFICHISDVARGDIVWALEKTRLDSLDRVTGTAVIRPRMYGSQVLIDFRFNAVTYEVFDGIFLRGRVSKATKVRDYSGNDVHRVLYAPPNVVPRCPR